MKKKIAILVLAVALVASMSVASAVACLPGLSPGYWKHNVKVYCGGPGRYSAPYEGAPHESDDSMLGYAALIIARWGDHPDFPDVEDEDGLLKWANGIFQDNANKALWLPLANAFNIVAGYLPYSD